MLRAAAVSLLGIVLSTCILGAEPADGYALVEGTVTRQDGSRFQGEVFVACGDPLGDWFGLLTRTDRRGSYRVELKVPEMTREDRSATEFTLLCAATAPGSAPTWARTIRQVRFAVERSGRRTTRMNLTEGQMDPMDL